MSKLIAPSHCGDRFLSCWRGLAIVLLVSSTTGLVAAVPTVTNSTVTVNQPSVGNLNLLTWASDDATGDPDLTFEITRAPTHGALTPLFPSNIKPGYRTGYYVYTPTFDYQGPDSVQWRVSDGSGWSQVATVSIISNRMVFPARKDRSGDIIPEHGGNALGWQTLFVIPITEDPALHGTKLSAADYDFRVRQGQLVDRMWRNMSHNRLAADVTVMDTWVHHFNDLSNHSGAIPSEDRVRTLRPDFHRDRWDIICYDNKSGGKGWGARKQVTTAFRLEGGNVLAHELGHALGYGHYDGGKLGTAWMSPAIWHNAGWLPVRDRNGLRRWKRVYADAGLDIAVTNLDGSNAGPVGTQYLQAIQLAGNRWMLTHPGGGGKVRLYNGYHLESEFGPGQSHSFDSGYPTNPQTITISVPANPMRTLANGLKAVHVDIDYSGSGYSEGNYLPQVNITAPFRLHGTCYDLVLPHRVGQRFDLAAAGIDVDGSVTGMSVKVTRERMKIRENSYTGASVAWSWTPSEPGLYEVTTRATDNATPIAGARIAKFKLYVTNAGGPVTPPPADDLVAVTAPTAVTQGQTATVNVQYSASTDRDLWVYLQLDTSPYTTYASKKIDVSAGSGAVAVTLDIPADLPVANEAYQFQSFLTTDGGNWNTKLNNIVKDNIDCLADSGTLRQPENPAKVVAGLNSAYYERAGMDSVADLTGTPVWSDASTTGFDLGLRERDNDFGFVFTGFLDVPADGHYTLFTSSDDGSRLWIGDTMVVDNDGLHGTRERSGTIGLKAGRHALKVAFFERGGGQVLTVSWQGPGLAKQTIPTGRLWRLQNEQLFGPGLIARYYHPGTNMAAMPNFGALTPDATQIVATVNQPSTKAAWPGLTFSNDFAARYTGLIKIDTAGTYTFFTSSDDGSNLFINGTKVVDNDGRHAWRERSGTRTLDAGYHEIDLRFFEDGGGAGVQLQWQGPGISKQVVPATQLFHEAEVPVANG